MLFLVPLHTSGKWANGGRVDKRSRQILKKCLARFGDGCLISESIPTPPGKYLDRYLPMAEAEFKLGRFPQAADHLRQLLAIHPDDPLLLTGLGAVLAAQGNLSEAVLLLKHALAIDELESGRDNPVVAENLEILAAVYVDQGKYSEAEALYKRALEIDEKELGPDDQSMGEGLAGLGLLYLDAR